MQLNRSPSAQSQQFTPTQTSSQIASPPWTASSQPNDNLMTTSGGVYGVSTNAGGTTYESSDTFGRRFTGSGSTSTISPPVYVSLM